MTTVNKLAVAASEPEASEQGSRFLLMYVGKNLLFTLARCMVVPVHFLPWYWAAICRRAVWSVSHLINRTCPSFGH